MDNLLSRLKHFSSFLILFLVGMNASSQQLVVSGKIIDESSGSPIPYATVALLSVRDSSMVAGTTSGDDGSFVVSSKGMEVFLELSFIGYLPKRFDELPVTGTVNLGDISLAPDMEMIEGVDVTAEKSTVEFKLDKRVFNVGKDIGSSGMGALEVLDNVPSVNVDIEGNITLRGNSGVQILINGKPSVLSDDGSNALGTITADMIESVEVITNPSAKYEAEGTSGIINVILKKEEKKGFNGSMSANTGIPDNHSLGASLNLRTDNFNFFTQFGVGYRSLPNYNNSLIESQSDGSILRTDGTEYRNEEFYNITLGSDYYLNKLNTITLSGSFAYEVEEQPSETEFSSLGEGGELLTEWIREENTSATNPKYQYDLQYEKKFANNEDHVLLFSTQGQFFGKELSSAFSNTATFGNIELDYQETKTDFYQADYTAKLDYTNPLNEQFTIEAGGLYEINDVGNDYQVSNEIDGVLVPDSGLTNNFEYDQKVLGLYGTGSYEGKKWGIKLGLRVENTDLLTLLTNTNEKNSQLYTNLFPSAHTSFKFSKMFQVQAGYSRRIFRPRLWDLNPFFNIRNNFNIRQGNPDLLPEFGDSYDLTGILIFEKLTANASVYYLFTRDQIERISVFDGNVSVTTPMNIGTNSSTGVEIFVKYAVSKWLSLTGEASYGVFQRKGQFEEQNFDFNGERHSGELTAKLKLKGGVDLETSVEYRSDVLTVQGMSSGFTWADAGIRKKFLDGKLIVDVNVRDIFASRKRESIVDQPQTYFYSFSQRGRFLRLGVSYSFGKGEAMTYTGRRH